MQVLEPGGHQGAPLTGNRFLPVRHTPEMDLQVSAHSRTLGAGECGLARPEDAAAPGPAPPVQLRLGGPVQTRGGGPRPGTHGARQPAIVSSDNLYHISTIAVYLNKLAITPVFAQEITVWKQITDNYNEKRRLYLSGYF